MLEPVDSVKSRRRDTVYYILGVFALAVTAFWERDLRNFDDMMQGGVVFGARAPSSSLLSILLIIQYSLSIRLIS